jgi:hypothetical protein
MRRIVVPFDRGVDPLLPYFFSSLLDRPLSQAGLKARLYFQGEEPLTSC